MTVSDTPSLGLRERKKERTRQRIVEAARGLFSERGYRATTVAVIAAGAETSVPTLFKYFATKEDIFFSHIAARHASWTQKVQDRPATQDTIEALIKWMVDDLPKIVASDPDWDAAYRRILKENPELQEARQKHIQRNQGLLAIEISRDLGEPAQSLRPQLLAATTLAALDTAWRAARSEPAVTPENPLNPIDYARAFLRAGHDALLQLPPPSS
jgi:AcrR family transcriptional regulator